MYQARTARRNLQEAQNRAQNEATTRQFNLVKSKEERDEIVKKLNTFYGPFKQLRANLP